ncbi:hypothetical protein [Comamonas sp.]|uniref:hypothetical protein n=1 Tax=Comamonas sp. TaxID=34028 RepID=UPI0028AFA737|nr:hypothetical protein [Comamonas sp.]
MNQEQIEFFITRYAEQIDELQIEVAALGTAVRTMLEFVDDKEAFRIRLNQIFSASAAKTMPSESLAAHEARHQALIDRLTGQRKL